MTDSNGIVDMYCSAKVQWGSNTDSVGEIGQLQGADFFKFKFWYVEFMVMFFSIDQLFLRILQSWSKTF